MTDTASNNKRIAKNTFFLYFRMILKLFVSLYTSRVVLEVLGVEDFGIYNLIAGFVSLFVFFSSSLTNVFQRYLNIGLGASDYEQTRLYFSQSVTILLVLSILIILLGETVGIWFVKNHLVIPVERLYSALWVYQISIVMIVLQLVQVIFISAIIANESMGVYAYLGVFDVLAKLCVVYLIQSINYDALIVYAMLLLAISVFIFGIYLIYCVKKYPEVSFKLCFNKTLLKDMSRFVGYNLFGCFAWSASYQGVNIILNMFFGPVVNAARGIATQVTTALNGFIDGIITAFKPQIIKSYANNDNEYMISLFEKSSKYSFWMTLLLSVPIIVNAKYILCLWLKDVPDYSIVFVQLSLVDIMIASLGQPIWILAMATGKIKNNQVWGRMFNLLSLPLSIIILYIYENVYIPMVIIIIMQFLYVIYSYLDIRNQVKLHTFQYFKNVVLPCLVVLLIIGGAGSCIYAYFQATTFFILCIETIFLIAITLLVMFCLLDMNERIAVKKIVNKFYKNK